MKHHQSLKLIILIFLLALGLRLYGLNWDLGTHLHPDERFLTMVLTTIKLPDSLSQYLSTSTSPLNPYNYPDYQFFVYGTFPLFLTKIVGQIFNLTGYDQIHFVGRVLSALFDSGNIILLFFLAKKVFKPTSKSIFLPSLLYAFCVLPIQLSHFFAVDTFLTFFLLSTFTLLVYKKYFLAPIAFGLALACKISALYFSPIFALFIFISFLKIKNLMYLFLITVHCSLFTFLTFRFFQPYAFNGLASLNPQFISNLKTLSSYNNPDGWFPPAVQWLSKTPLIFSLQNIVFWGLGLPLTILFVFSMFKINLKKIPLPIWTSLGWVLFLFLYQGTQFVTSMRYFLPIYPFLILIIIYLSKNISKIKYWLIVLHLIFGLSFLSIYSKPHTRIQASNWIYQNIPAGDLITNEYWDDPLPLYLSGQNPNQYQGIMLSLYDPDSKQKWDSLQPQINQADYIIMSSNRLWGSIPLVPGKYPTTTKFYQDIFDENLGFTKVAEFNSYLGISFSFLKNCYYFGPTNYPYSTKSNSWFTITSQCPYPGIYLRDDTAEEAFTVYDHPKVLIYKNQKFR